MSNQSNSLEKMYDYYFSQLAVERFRDIHKRQYYYEPNTVNGIPYTEMVDVGRVPSQSRFPDCVKVYTGPLRNIKVCQGLIDYSDAKLRHELRTGMRTR